MKHSNIVTRREFLASAAATGLVATGASSWVMRPTQAFGADPIKVGVLFDLTGGLGAIGASCVNTMKMVTNEINSGGGLLGRPLELHIVDSATNEAVGVSAARKLVQRDKVDVVIGAMASSMRNAVKPVITASNTVWLYPSLYEGGECTPNLFVTGPTPAQQCNEFIPWLIARGGTKFALPGSNYVWPRKLFDYARNVIESNGATVTFEDYYPFDQIDFSAAVSQIISSGSNVVFAAITPPGAGPFFKQLHEARFSENGGHLTCLYYDENALLMNQPHEIEGLASTLDYFVDAGKDDPASTRIQAAYDEQFPGDFKFTAGSQATGTYRAAKLWEAAVKEAGSIETTAVSAALDHSKLEEGPGGPCEMVPGERHVKMRMYIAVAKNGLFEVVERSSGLVDPEEC